MAPLRRFAAIGGLWAALLSAMAINGYPFLYWDTSGYVNPAVFENIRSAYYSLFVNALFALGLSPVGVAVVQSLIVLIVLIAVFAIADIPVGRAAWHAAPILAGSTLPAHTAFLMPDMFLGVSVVALFGCLEMRIDSPRSRALFAFLAALVVFSFGAHASAPFVLLFLGIAYVPFAWKDGATRRRLKLVALLMLGALGLSLAETRIRARAFGLASPGMAFLAARFAEEGLLERYLPEVCRTDPSIRLCAYPAAAIPRESDLFLWGWRKPSVNMQDVYGTPGEEFSAFKNAQRDLVIVDRTILAEEHIGLLKYVPRRVWHAMSAYRSLDEMKNLGIATEINIVPTLDRLEQRFPGSRAEILSRSAQLNPERNGVMRHYVAVISYLVPVVLFLHLLALWHLRRGNPLLFRFALVSLLAIGANLIVYATLSSPYGARYYDRLGWVSALVVAWWAASAWEKRAAPGSQSIASRTLPSHPP